MKTIDAKRLDIRRAKISDGALAVVDDLESAGFEALLVGGCVRDLAVGKAPKDFDVVTNATPREIVSVCRRARLIGRRFELVHVRKGREIIEVSTYRAASPHNDGEKSHLNPQNQFGTQQEDAVRRDFTVNALLYDPGTETVIDHTTGIADLKERILRMIGDPDHRIQDDPMRMLRAIRFEAKLGFALEESLEQAIYAHADRLREVPSARRFDELLKLFHGGHSRQIMPRLAQTGLLTHVLPGAAEVYRRGQQADIDLIHYALENTDRRIAREQPVIAAFLFAATLWPVFRDRVNRADRGQSPPQTHWLAVAEQVIQSECGTTSMPRRISAVVKDIWWLQERLRTAKGKRAERLMRNKRFRAAYDFLLLRIKAGDAPAELGEFWTARESNVSAEVKAARRHAPDTESRPPGRRQRPHRRRRRTS